MHDWVELLDSVSEEDVAWLLNTGEDRRIETGDVLVSEGGEADSLFFVIDGLLEVSLAARNGRPIARLGPGEIVGEISFLDSRPVSATVRAAEASRVLELPRNLLAARLQVDRGFAARFYHALAVVLARRLRQASASSGEAAASEENSSAKEAPAWQALAPSIEHFKLAVSSAAHSAHGEPRLAESHERVVEQRFAELLAALHETLGENSQTVESVKDELGRYARHELLPYILLTRAAHRIHAKPRGYPVDFQALELIQDNEPAGSGPLGMFLDRLFLQTTAAETMRARRRLLGAEIGRTIASAAARSFPARVTSLGCGPANEVFDAYSLLADKNALEATLLDFDLQALARISERVEREKLASQVRLINGNVAYLALGQELLDIEPQDLVYAPYLADAYSDGICKRVIDYAHAMLRPGGTFVLCGFHPHNDNREFMRHVLNWAPLHRTEADMNRLFAASAFRKPCTACELDERGATLFAECVK